MPRIDTKEYVTLGRFLHRKSRIIDGLPQSLQSRFKIAYNLSSIIVAIHNQGHLIIDLKPKNCSVHKKLLFTAIFDSDGFSIKIKNFNFPAKQPLRQNILLQNSLKRNLSKLIKSKTILHWQ